MRKQNSHSVADILINMALYSTKHYVIFVQLQWPNACRAALSLKLYLTSGFPKNSLIFMYNSLF